MKRLTDEELEELLSDLESDRVERKESDKGDAPEKIRQAICAFANDLPNHKKPGVIFVGVRDNGHSAGLTITDELLLKLADMRSDGQILPPPSMTVEKRRLLSMDIAVITVQPADAPPVRYKGRTYIRTGPRRDIASRQDERILNEKRRYRDLPFDLHPVSFAKLSDLNRLAFEQEYLIHAVAPDILAANQRSYEERLAACRFIESPENPCPTVSGCIVLGIRAQDLIPGNYIQFLRINGTQLTDAIQDEAEISGNLGEILRRLDEKLEAHIRTGIDIISGRTESRRPNYPLAALQQLTRNAVMHRNYEGTRAPVRLTWFNDRIEIHSPGGPFGQVTVENFGKSGFTDYRNPNIATAMKVLGYVQKFGMGIQIAQQELNKNGNPPARFEVNANYVLVEIRSAS
ncbi:ATP-binding protein [Thioflexithrix psekupsensis]|uniref:Transcriptional regulator n=1 Tax=Thioflexithrix psekupsensis TaxID=1570016 RepID=A0A251XAH3_9GAMM|nr:ATP-binding protein [Thioflexithrix psekupsensis]OUD15334.1 transcriptional regulator [Thioflexithrix psekupsensis]